MTEDSRVRAGRSVHAREFDGELVIVDLEGGDYFGLDELGGRVWNELMKGKSPREIAGALIDEYDVQPNVLLADIVKLVSDLAERKLVEPR